MSWKWLWETGKVFACKNNDKNHKMIKLSSVQSLSRVHLFATPWTVACQASLSITNSRSSLKLVHWVGDVIQPSHPLSSPSPPALNLSQNQGFSNEPVLHIRWPKYWSFSFNISPSNEHSGLISFRMDWLDLLVVQGTLKSLLHTTVQKHQFFGAQLCSSSNSHIHIWLLEKP